MDAFLKKDNKLMQQLVRKNKAMRAESAVSPPPHSTGTLREARAKQHEARNAPATHEYSPDRSVKVTTQLT